MYSPILFRAVNIFIKRIAFTLFVGLHVFSVTSVNAQENKNSVARFGTSSVGSTFYIIANGLGNLMQKHAGINMTVEPIGGSYANIFSLKAAKIDYAITNSGASYDGRYGIKPFEGSTQVTLIAQGQSSYRFILVRRDEHIKSLEDINGKIIIGRRPALPEMNAISTALINTAKLDDVNIVSTKNTKESLRHIKSGTVAGTIIPGGARVPAVVQLFRDGLVDPLYIPDNIIKIMQRDLPPYMYTQTFPAGHFDGQEKDLTVFGLNTYLVAGPHVNEDQVYLITKTLFEHKTEFSSFHNAAKQWTIQNTLTDPKIPYHPGSIRYFKEKGLWNEDLEDIQQTLLKK
jgi:TRAP transporter TAXI family solute receptor